MTTNDLILRRYRLDREIAVGGTARVWRALDTKRDRSVAVKLLHPHPLPDATSRRRLEGEAHAAEALSHPAIAAVYDVSGPDDDPALVMELVDGEPLSKVLERDGPMAPKDTHPSYLTDAKWDRGSTDGEIFTVIKEGAGPKFDMKGFKSKMTDQEIWNVVNYLHSLQAK